MKRAVYGQNDARNDFVGYGNDDGVCRDRDHWLMYKKTERVKNLSSAPQKGEHF